MSLAEKYPATVTSQVITDAVHINRAVLKKPFIRKNATIKTNYNIWEVYQAALRCEHEDLVKGDFAYDIDRTSRQWTSWSDWCREVIWYGNKKGDYVYPVKRSVK